MHSLPEDKDEVGETTPATSRYLNDIHTPGSKLAKNEAAL
jgi:hypothetical protein